MMSGYGVLDPEFWTGETGRHLRGHLEGQVVCAYLISNRHANMIGLYYLPMLYLCHETGLTIEGASKGLRRAIEGGFCSYDEASEVVWVHRMAEFRVAPALEPKDKRVQAVRKAYAEAPKCPFLPPFFDRYEQAFHLLERRGFEGASKGLRSQGQGQGQKQGQGQGQKEEADCAELLADSAPAVVLLPTNRSGEEVGISEQQVQELQALYPAVNVRQQLRNMRGWLLSHERERKTSRGMLAFVTTWLKREQDRGGALARAGPSGVRTRPASGVDAVKQVLAEMAQGGADETGRGGSAGGGDRLSLPGLAGET